MWFIRMHLHLPTYTFACGGTAGVVHLWSLPGADSASPIAAQGGHSAPTHIQEGPVGSDAVVRGAHENGEWGDVATGAHVTVPVAKGATVRCVALHGSGVLLAGLDDGRLIVLLRAQA